MLEFENVSYVYGANTPYKKTAVDNVPGHISLAFELVYPESVRQAVRQGYLDKMLAFESDNPDTRKKMQEINRIMKEYITERGIE